MKVTLLKLTRKKEVVKRLEPQALADMIRNQFMKPIRMDDGQVTIDSDKHLVNLSRICFAAEFDFYREKPRVHHYNGLVVIEVNGLKTYEEAVSIRNKAAKMDETLMAFLGASGMSVKIVCRGELFGTSTDSFIRTYMTRLEGHTRISSDWTSSIWSPSWSAPYTSVPIRRCTSTPRHAPSRLTASGTTSQSPHPSHGRAACSCQDEPSREPITSTGSSSSGRSSESASICPTRIVRCRCSSRLRASRSNRAYP